MHKIILLTWYVEVIICWYSYCISVLSWTFFKQWRRIWFLKKTSWSYGFCPSVSYMLDCFYWFMFNNYILFCFKEKVHLYFKVSIAACVCNPNISEAEVGRLSWIWEQTYLSWFQTGLGCGKTLSQKNKRKSRKK